MSTPTEVKAPSAITDAMAVPRDISERHLAVGLLAMFVLYLIVRGPSRFLSATGAVQVLARDIGTFAVPVLLGWASAKIHEVLARRRGRARTALRRNTLVAAWAFGLVMVVGLAAERRDAARTSEAEQQAKLAAVQPRIPEAATKGANASPSQRALTPAEIAEPAPGEDSTAAKPVVINVVTPWVEIARMPQYVQASSAEREAIRDLYWRICVEDRIPPAQRTSAYELFVRNWTSRESGGSEATTRTTSLSQHLREQQVAVPPPVNAETMRRWCGR